MQKIMMHDSSPSLSLDTLLGHLPGMVYRSRNDAARTMEFVSIGVLSLTGYPPEALLGNRDIAYADLMHPEDRDRIGAEIGAALAKGAPFQASYRLRLPGGVEKWVSEQGNAVRNAGGDVLALEGYVSDITDSKRAEQAILQSEARFKSVARAATDAVWEWDLGSNRLWWNEGLHTAFGHPPADKETTTESWLGQIHPDDQDRVLKSMRAAIRGGGNTWTDEYRFRRADGSWAYVQDRAFLVRDADQRVMRMVGGMADLSESKRAQREAEQAAAMQRRIIEAQREIASSPATLPEAMNLMARRAMELTNAAGAVIELVDGDEMVRLAAAGCADVDAWPRMPRKGSLGGLALESGQVVHADDASEDPRAESSAARALGLRSVIAAPLREGEQLIGAVKVMAPGAGAFSPSDVHHLQLLSESLGAVILRYHAAEQLRLSELQYRFLFYNHPHPMWVYETASLHILAANRAAVTHYGYSEQEFRGLSLYALHPPEDAEELRRQVQTVGDIRRRNRVWRQIKRDGSLIEVEIFSEVTEFDGRPARVVLATDITERRRAERDLLRVTRAREMLSACNQALLRGEAEDALLRDICRIAVEIGGYGMAWVGFAEDDEAGTIRPVSHYGIAGDQSRALRLSWRAQDPAGQGPAGETIRSGKVIVIDDAMQGAATLAPEMAGDYRSGVWLPLRSRSRTFGLLCLYGAQVARRSADEIRLLQSLADNLAYGLENLRLQQERLALQAAALKVAAAVSAAPGPAFFRQLVFNLVEIAGGIAGYLVRAQPGEPLRGRTIAVVARGAQEENFDVDATSDVCQRLMSSGAWLVQDEASICHALPPSLGNLPARAFGGRRLSNALGEPLGVLVVLFEEPPVQVDFVSSILQIFAARAAAELERQIADARIREQASLLDNAKDAIVVRGVDHRIRFWNKGAERLYGWTQEEALGRSIAELLFDDTAALDEATGYLMQHGEWVGEIHEKHKDGHFLTVEGHWTLVCDETGKPESIFAIKTDISQRKAAEQEIKHLAFYDALTTLPNRLLLMDRLKHALSANARSHREGALLFIDLDNFKTLNDTLGHHMGDQLLQQVGKRLSASVREADTVARLGGDEFVVMLENLSAETIEAAEQARAVAEKILHALNQPFELAGIEHVSTPSIGITLFGEHHNDVGELLKRADLAMYHAKSAGRNTLRFFDPLMQTAITRRVTLESELRQALLSRQITVHYQPQVNYQGEVTGVEALARWMHPQRGMIPPGEFIGVAEETDLIMPLGRLVLETACAQLAVWQQRPEFADLSIAINVSAHEFRHPAFVDQTLSVLNRFGVDPSRIKLELTESLLVDNMEATVVKMAALKESGVRFALDDFGTGYSSLFYLKRLPLDQLKIDQSFIRDVLSDPNDAAIVCTIIALGQTLGLAVIAEGVETPDIREFLAHNGCFAYQGYLFSGALPAADCERFILARMRQPDLV